MKEPTQLIERVKELVKSNYSLPEIVSICEQEGILSPRTGRPFSKGSVRYWLDKYNIKIKNKRRKMKEPTQLIERVKELAKLNYNLPKIVSICEQEGILSPRTGRPFSHYSVRYWLYEYNIKVNPKLANAKNPPTQLIERARELAKLKYSVAKIVSICEQEGILSPRTGRPFSYYSVKYWLDKHGIKGPSKHESKTNEEFLKYIFTRSLQEMGMKPDQIERELKELL